MSSAILSALHVLALGLGLPAVFFRGRALRAVQTDPAAVPKVLSADSAWGVAALLWYAAVRRYLTDNGVAASRLKATGKGESQLLNSDDPNAAENRRVEIQATGG